MTEGSYVRRDILIFLPTYNEIGNVRPIAAALRQVVPEANILFLDDNSPDGTGLALDHMAAADPHITVIHRPAKLGIGSAHQEGIAWAYARGYRMLLTMDSDFAHSPEYVRAFIDQGAEWDVVVGTRFERPDSLAQWRMHRKALTWFGHKLTRLLLALPYDATGALRRYRLDRIPEAAFALVEARDYAFFFESLHVLYLNHFRIHELPIHLPARTYGESKMRLNDVWNGFCKLLGQAVRARRHRERLLLPKGASTPADERAAWDKYWEIKEPHARASALYDLIAAFYRRYIIKDFLDRFLARNFAPGAKLLHAGCGGGQVDATSVGRYAVTAFDISPMAIERYMHLHQHAAVAVEGDLFRLPFADAVFDGLYNLGVMEHFERDRIPALLREFRRVLRPGGRMVLFWPPEWGFSVMVLKAAHFVLNDVLGKNIRLHPPEPTRVRTKREIAAWLAAENLKLVDFSFGPADAFTHVVVVAERA